MNTIDILRIMVIPYLEDQEDVAMYQAYFAALTKNLAEGAEEKKQDWRWFTCKPCVVTWRDQALRSHCFACGKWGLRGVHVH